MPEIVSSKSDRQVSRHSPTTLLDSTSLGLSQVSIVEPGRLVFISGQTATPLDRDEFPPDLSDQVRVVASNLSAALDDLGASPHDVVMLRVYLAAATTERFEQAWSPIRDILKSALPSMTGIGVQALWTPALQLEDEMIVRMP